MEWVKPHPFGRSGTSYDRQIYEVPYTERYVVARQALEGIPWCCKARARQSYDEGAAINIKEFLEIAVPPLTVDVAWLEGAETAVDYLVSNGRSDEIIIFSNVGQTYVNAVLVPLASLSPETFKELEHASIDPTAHWALEHVSGGGQPDRMYLSDPLDDRGCKALVGGEQLVFRRQFIGVDKGPPRTELSQRLVQALDLYFMEEHDAYCRLDSNGDVEPIIKLHDLSGSGAQSSAMLVTIAAEQMHRYMAVTETALAVKFDFTRYRPNGMFCGWHQPDSGEHAGDDISYHTGVQVGASFANGALVVRPVLTKEMIIARSRREWDGTDKQYATFKAHDWKNNRLAEISCAPTALASYFDEGSGLPFQTTPAFFRPDVLAKYKSDPEKYTLEHRSISARGGWYLKSYDVNEEGQVHAYLYDLANLPYSEQLYWQSFNEWPKTGISKRAFETDFQGSFDSTPDPLLDLKYEISKLDHLAPDWWKPRGEAAGQAVHYPVSASPEEWSNAMLALDQLVVEGFVVKELRSRLQAEGKKPDNSWGSIRLLQEWLIRAGLDAEDAAATVEPLKRAHFFRSKAKGHLAETEKQALIKAARKEHGSLAAHFRNLVAEVQASFDRIIEKL